MVYPEGALPKFTVKGKLSSPALSATRVSVITASISPAFNVNSFAEAVKSVPSVARPENVTGMLMLDVAGASAINLMSTVPEASV